MIVTQDVGRSDQPCPARPHRTTPQDSSTQTLCQDLQSGTCADKLVDWPYTHSVSTWGTSQRGVQFSSAAPDSARDHFQLSGVDLPAPIQDGGTKDFTTADLCPPNLLWPQDLASMDPPMPPPSIPLPALPSYVVVGIYRRRGCVWQSFWLDVLGMVEHSRTCHCLTQS